MKFGFFDDSNQEYVITTPKTPLPWINYLGCNEFFSLISNTCGGYTFYKDAKLLRMTRYRYNCVPGDVNGIDSPKMRVRPIAEARPFVIDKEATVSYAGLL